MKTRFIALLVIGILLAFAHSGDGQTTLITYQGSLNFSNQPATGTYDFEFRLYPSQFSGTQIGSTVSVNAVSVTNGQFVVELNFGQNYTSDRFLDIQVRQTGTQTFTSLTPRQRVTSSPSAINALSAIEADIADLAVLAGNANNLGGVAANQYLTTATANTNYIRNSATQQAATNFNISGTGTAGILNAATQFNIGGVRVLSKPGTGNLIAGENAGSAAITGIGNSFFGRQAGQANTNGNNNTFIGDGAGRSNVSGPSNVFIGTSAGESNVSNGANVYVGINSGNASTGGQNTFIGAAAGLNTITGSFNTFLGNIAGLSNVSGSNNTMLGQQSNVGSGALSYATALGAGSVVWTSSTVKLGRIDDTVIAPNRMILGDETNPKGELSIYANTGNADLYLQGAGPNNGINLAASADVNPFFFISHYNGTTYTDRLIITSAGTVRIPTLGSAGATALCRNASNDISTCSSSAKYKSNISSYRPALNIVERLRPVTFNWKDGNALDLGLVAEEVAEIDPLLVTYNDKGEVEGVKYDRIGVVLINTVKEQQSRIEKLESELADLRKLIADKIKEEKQ